MIPNSKIFCNAPWYELQIYHDGGLGFCCQESHKLYDDAQSDHYNVRNMSIREWMDSAPMRAARMGMFGADANSFCSRCYAEETTGGTSRRHRCNQKSVIFTKTNFEQSYQQSPGHSKFELTRQEQGAYDGMPIDLHIDLGNYCNLTCKMCNPSASSAIAVQHVKWGIQESKRYIGTDWTRDEKVWNRVLEEIASIPGLNNVHFMGGETLLTKRFEDFVDFMIDREKFDLCFSFVTNGTTFNQALIDKLTRFRRVGIEVSIESLTEHNAYQRQGTDTKQVLDHLHRYQRYCNQGCITVTVRPAISLLTIGSYHTLLDHCLQNQFIVKSLVCYRPRYLNVSMLPNHVKSAYLERYQDFLYRNNLHLVDSDLDYNESDPNQIQRIIKTQTLQAMNLLLTPRPPDAEQELEKMVHWCKKWDSVHGYDARSFYPDLTEIFDRYGY